jgi:hypothetical protein
MAKDNIPGVGFRAAPISVNDALARASPPRIETRETLKGKEDVSATPVLKKRGRERQHPHNNHDSNENKLHDHEHD